MGVEEADVAGLRARHVDFYEFAAGEYVGYGEEHVDELGSSRFAWFAYLYHGGGFIFVIEFATCGADFGPCFAMKSMSMLVEAVRWGVLELTHLLPGGM